MEKLEEAILSVCSPPGSGPSPQDLQCQKYCEALIDTPDSWRMLLELFASTSRSLEVRFWCLQKVVEMVNGIGNSGRTELRTCLLQFVCTTDGDSLHSGLKNKLCVLYIRLIQADYFADVNVWPGAFKEVIHTASVSLFGREFCLKVLITFDEEVASEEYTRSTEMRNRNTIIKDSVRVYDAEQIIEFLKQVLDCNHSTHTTLALTVLSQLAVWMDILLIANQNVLARVYTLLQSSTPEVAYTAWEPLSAILYKRMDPSQKVTLIHELKLTAPVMQGLGSLQESSCADQRGTAYVNTISLQLLDCFVRLRDEQPRAPHNSERTRRLALQAWSLLEELLTPITKLLVNMPCAPRALEPFLSEFGTRIRHCIANPLKPFDPTEKSACDLTRSVLTDERKSKEAVKEHHADLRIPVEDIRPFVQTLLRIILHLIQYPRTFRSYELPEDAAHSEELEFLDFRDDISKLYKKIMLLDEQATFDWLYMIVHQLVENFERVNFTQTHAVLYLFYLTGEQVRDLSAVIRQEVHPLTKCLGALFNSSLLESSEAEQCNHPVVRACMLNLLSRYSSFLVQNRDFMLKALKTLLLERGLLHPGSRLVVCKATQVLLKILKQHANMIASNFTNECFQLLSPMLIISIGSEKDAPPLVSKQFESEKYSKGCLTSAKVEGYLFTQEEQMSLFEAVGCLVGSPANHMYCRLVLQNLTMPLNDLRNLDNIATSSPVAGGIWVSRHLQAMASFSKGFHSSTNSQKEWITCFNIVLPAVKLFMTEYRVRTSTLFLCRRMVTLLGQPSLNPIVDLLHIFYDPTAVPPSQVGSYELQQLGVFFIHVLVTFKSPDAQPTLYTLMPIAFERHFLSWAGTPRSSSFYVEERQQAQVLLCSLLASAGNYNTMLLVSMLAQERIPFDQAGQTSGSIGSFSLYLDSFPENDPDLNASRKLFRVQEHIGYYLKQFLLLSCTTPSTSLSSVVFSLQAISCLVRYALQPAHINSAEQFLEKLSLMTVLQESGSLVFRAEVDDAQWLKVFHEVCHLYRSLCAANEVPESLRVNLWNAVQRTFTEAGSVDAADASSVLESVIKAKDPREARDRLWEWKQRLFKAA